MNRLFGSGTGKCNNTVSNQNNGEDDKNTDQNNHTFLGLNGMFSSGETFICTRLDFFIIYPFHNKFLLFYPKPNICLYEINIIREHVFVNRKYEQILLT